MFDLQFNASRNIEFIFFHQIVNLVDRASRAVFYRQQTICAKAGIYGGENILKILKSLKVECIAVIEGRIDNKSIIANGVNG